MLKAIQCLTETEYWLELLYDGDCLSEEEFGSIYRDCRELYTLLLPLTERSRESYLEASSDPVYARVAKVTLDVLNHQRSA